VHAQDGGLRRVDDGRAHQRPERAAVGDAVAEAYELWERLFDSVLFRT
jgi:hypothetical protein